MPVSVSILFDSTITLLVGRTGEPSSPNLLRRTADQRLARELQDAGLMVEIAVNGQIALELAHKAAFALVFMAHEAMYRCRSRSASIHAHSQVQNAEEGQGRFF